MKLTTLFLVVLAGAAQASPYFRLIDPSHPQPVVGALLAPDNMGDTAAASLLPLVTHSPKDGCLFPKLVCEDWTPLAIGASVNAGKLTFDVAPLANVLPWVQAAAQAAMPEGYNSPVGWLKPSEGQAVTFSAGPVWEYRQLTNKGYFRVFTGVALHF